MKISKIIKRFKYFKSPKLCYRIALGYVKRFIAKLTGFQWKHFVLFSLEEEAIRSLAKEYTAKDKVRIGECLDFEHPAVIKELGKDHSRLLQERCMKGQYDCVVLIDSTEKNQNKNAGRVKCFGCISYAKFEITSSLQYQLNSHEAFLFDDYCMQDSRRKGYYKQIMAARMQLLIDKGFSKVLTIVDEMNTPSMEAHKTWKVEQTFYWYKFKGKEYSSLKSFSKL